mmetsp:Transcript_625/g.1479  ORF Transcript_625/g.1479 Transcript_625/m.1479 type:complete len:82 (-) Transcript_625:1768-2013(-)
MNCPLVPAPLNFYCRTFVSFCYQEHSYGDLRVRLHDLSFSFGPIRWKQNLAGSNWVYLAGSIWMHPVKESSSLALSVAFHS